MASTLFSELINGTDDMRSDQAAMIGVNTNTGKRYKIQAEVARLNYVDIPTTCNVSHTVVTAKLKNSDDSLYEVNNAYY